jgi:hypothetical protein
MDAIFVRACRDGNASAGRNCIHGFLPVHSFPTTTPMGLDFYLGSFESVCAEPDVYGRSPVPREQEGDVARFLGVALACGRLLVMMAAEYNRESH